MQEWSDWCILTANTYQEGLLSMWSLRLHNNSPQQVRELTELPPTSWKCRHTYRAIRRVWSELYLEGSHRQTQNHFLGSWVIWLRWSEETFVRAPGQKGILPMVTLHHKNSQLVKCTGPDDLGQLHLGVESYTYWCMWLENFSYAYIPRTTSSLTQYYTLFQSWFLHVLLLNCRVS